ncbi:MAG: hypothetical protein AB7K04_00185 [Pseudorhodoplanes sp.]
MFPPVPPLIWVAAGVAGAIALVRLITRERKRINTELEQARARARGENAPRRTLRRDQDGVYRP